MKKIDKDPSVKLNIIMNGLLLITSTLFPLITYPYTTKVLGPDGIGKVGMATSYISYFVGASQLGIPVYGIRACAKVRNNRDELTKITKELLIINLFLSLISYAVLIFTVFFVDQLAQEKALYFIISSTIVFNMIGVEWLYKGLEQYTYITIRSIICKIIAIIALFLLVHSEKDYTIYGAISILASSASSIFNFVHMRSVVDLRKNYKYVFRRHIKPILTIYVMSVATAIYQNLDAVMLGFMTDTTTVGIYETAVKLKTILIGLVTSVGAVLLPRSSVYIESKQYDQFSVLNKKAMHFSLLLSVALMIYFIVFAKQSILFIADERYYRSVVTLRWVMPLIIIIGITYNMGMSMLIPAGLEKTVSIAALAGAITDLILNALLIPVLHENGAAIGTLIAECVVLFVEGRAVIRIPWMKVTMQGMPWGKIVISIIAAFVSSIWFLFLDLSPILVLICSSILFFGVYIIMLYAMNDMLVRELVSDVIGKWRDYNGKRND